MGASVSAWNCIRCDKQVAFSAVDSAEVCPRAPDGGPHELHPHQFKKGRLDGGCNFPDAVAGSCGFRPEHDLHFVGVRQKEGE